MILTVLILLAVLSLWIFGPREPADLKTSFDEKSLGSNLDFYLETVEAKLPDIVPGTENASFGMEHRIKKHQFRLFIFMGFLQVQKKSGQYLMRWLNQ